MAPQTRSFPLIAALLVVVGLAQPALAMDVQINEVNSSIRTDEGGGGSFLGPLVKAVTDALEQDAAKKRRQQDDRQPGRPA
jgi:hypothetical protein